MTKVNIVPRGRLPAPDRITHPGSPPVCLKMAEAVSVAFGKSLLDRKEMSGKSGFEKNVPVGLADRTT